MNWFVVYTKPLQERRALENLERQGFEAYLPLISVQKVRAGRLAQVVEPLFSRYMFVRMDAGADPWGAIRSTLGVSRLLTVGNAPVPVPQGLVQALRALEHERQGEPQGLLSPGDAVRLVDGPLRGLDGVFEQPDGQARAMVLVHVLSRPQRVSVEASHLAPL